MINFGIVDNENAQQIYYLLKSIKKNCHFDYTVTIFECSKVNPIKNIIDDVKKVYCDVDEVEEIIHKEIPENLCYLDPNILIKQDFRIEDQSGSYKFGKNCYFLW